MQHRLAFPALKLAVALWSIAAPATAYAARVTIDPDHSNVGFNVRHLFTKVTGRFREFSGTILFEEDNPTASKVTATIQAASIDTNVETRDKDLRSPRFFDVEKFPTLTFQSGSVERAPNGRLVITGTLTMHGVAKEIALDAEFLGKGIDPWGNIRYGFHAVTKVNRKDFGMRWNEAIETGGVLVGDDVEIILDIEAIPAE
ncbi:MAG TPA: YceI family protein [Candidatus Polarisedimenticolia bacterium]|nr:YceI family protein [Candidatus Polarisedimenticolia bacterium]